MCSALCFGILCRRGDLSDVFVMVNLAWQNDVIMTSFLSDSCSVLVPRGFSILVVLLSDVLLTKTKIRINEKSKFSLTQ